MKQLKNILPMVLFMLLVVAGVSFGATDDPGCVAVKKAKTFVPIALKLVGFLLGAAGIGFAAKEAFQRQVGWALGAFIIGMVIGAVFYAMGVGAESLFTEFETSVC